MQKTILITGTSTGLGQSLSIKLAKAGYKVYATMRDLGKKSKLQDEATRAGVSLEIKSLDVQQQSTIDRCVEEMVKQEGRIDILINNAGAGFVKTTEHATEKEIQWVFDLNFMGIVRCTKAVLPHMRAAKSGRIINISSVGGLVGQPFNELYCAAKFAVEGYTESLATYVQPSFNIKFTVVEPGGIKSEFMKNVLGQLEQTGGVRQDDYLPVFQKYVNAVQNRPPEEAARVYQTSDEVADAVIAGCVDSVNPPIRMRTSPWSNEFTELKTSADPTGKLLQQKMIKQFLTG